MEFESLIFCPQILATCCKFRVFLDRNAWLKQTMRARSSETAYFIPTSMSILNEWWFLCFSFFENNNLHQHEFLCTWILVSNQISYNFIVICTIYVHCSTMEVQSVFLLIRFSSSVYFTDCNCNMTGANVFVSFRLYILWL